MYFGPWDDPDAPLAKYLPEAEFGQVIGVQTRLVLVVERVQGWRSFLPDGARGTHSESRCAAAA